MCAAAGKVLGEESGQIGFALQTSPGESPTASHYDNGCNTMSTTHTGAAERIGISEPDSGQDRRGL